MIAQVISEMEGTLRSDIYKGGKLRQDGFFLNQ